ncbi:MAG: hypothetical protein ACRC78_13145 [Planktothrix sp.]
MFPIPDVKQGDGAFCAVPIFDCGKPVDLTNYVRIDMIVRNRMGTVYANYSTEAEVGYGVINVNPAAKYVIEFELESAQTRQLPVGPLEATIKVIMPSVDAFSGYIETNYDLHFLTIRRGYIV